MHAQTSNLPIATPIPIPIWDNGNSQNLVASFPVSGSQSARIVQEATFAEAVSATTTPPKKESIHLNREWQAISFLQKYTTNQALQRSFQEYNEENDKLNNTRKVSFPWKQTIFWTIFSIGSVATPSPAREVLGLAAVTAIVAVGIDVFPTALSVNDQCVRVETMERHVLRAIADCKNELLQEVLQQKRRLENKLPTTIVELTGEIYEIERDLAFANATISLLKKFS